MQTYRVVRGPRAVVGGPVQRGGVAATGDEGGQADAEEQLVRDGSLALGQAGLPSRGGHDGGGQEGGDDGGELHCDGMIQEGLLEQQKHSLHERGGHSSLCIRLPRPSILAEIARMGRREIHGAVLLCCQLTIAAWGLTFPSRKCLSHLPIASQLKNRATGKYHEGAHRPSHLSLQVSFPIADHHHITRTGQGDPAFVLGASNGEASG